MAQALKALVNYPMGTIHHIAKIHELRNHVTLDVDLSSNGGANSQCIIYGVAKDVMILLGEMAFQGFYDIEHVNRA